jgi:hypothetical protein
MRLLLGLLYLLPLFAEPVPVLVELFTSEGCSSCPPADTLLARLETEQPVPGAMVIVLSEHVDYWDQLGWRDPFSNSQFTRRQGNYASRLGTQGNYTPQMVVDGRAEFVGSDTRRALGSIAEAAHRPKVTVRLTSTSRNTGEWTLHVEVGPVPESAEVMVALVEPNVATQVARGENGGRELRHAGVVRALQSAGSVAKSATFTKDVPLKTTSPRQRAVVFVQTKNQGPVLGAALLP